MNEKTREVAEGAEEDEEERKNILNDISLLVDLISR